MSYRKSFPLVLLILLLIMPGSQYIWFDGLPLSNAFERLGIVLIAYVAVSTTCRQKIRHLLSQNWIHRSGTTLLLIVLVAKLWSYFAFPLGGGFETCLRSLYAPTESCEKSYEGLFLTRDGINALGSISRVDDTINFGPIDRSRSDVDQDTAGSTWNLPFANDFPRLSELWLDRLPFRAEIGTRLRAERDSYLPVNLVGELEVRYSRGSRGDQGTDVYRYASYATEQRHYVPIPAGDGVLRLSYQFAEGVIGQIPDTPPDAQGPYAILELYELAQTPEFFQPALLTPSPRDEPNLPQGLALSALNLIVTAVVLGALLWVMSLRRIIIAVALSILSAVFATSVDRVIGIDSSAGVLTLVVVILLLFAGIVRSNLTNRWTAALSIGVGSGWVMIASTARRVTGIMETLPWGHILFRGRDSDWLVYQGYARQIFLEQSLRGGEGTYYFIPGMRYVAFLQHIVFGDSDLIIALSVLAILTATTLLLVQTVSTDRYSITTLIVAAVLLATWLRPLVLELVTYGAAEPIAWSLLIIGLLPWLHPHQMHPMSYYMSIGSIAGSVFLRPNLLLASGFLVIVLMMRQSTSGVGGVSRVRAILLCLVIFSLAFFHNLHYGESSTFFTTFVALDRELTIAEIFQSPFVAELRSVVIDKIRYALSWNTGQGNIGVNVTAWMIQIVWISALIAGVRRRETLAKLVVLASPMVYLVSLLPFRYTNIPSRHFIALSLFMGVSTLITQHRTGNSKSPLPNHYASS